MNFNGVEMTEKWNSKALEAFNSFKNISCIYFIFSSILKLYAW